jgi:hypothetical protein
MSDLIALTISQSLLWQFFFKEVNMFFGKSWGDLSDTRANLQKSFGLQRLV